MTNSYHITDFETSTDDWNLIVSSDPNTNIFLTPIWQQSWWDIMSNPHQDLLLLKCIYDECVSGIAPLTRENGSLTFLGGTDLCDIHDFIITSGMENHFFDSVLEFLDNQDWDIVKLESIPEWSSTLIHLPEKATARGYNVRVSHEDSLMGVNLPDTWDEYLSSLRKKDRHELRRRLRRLEESVEFDVIEIESHDEIAKHIDDFLELMGQSRDEKSAFLTPERDSFFRQMCSKLAEQNLVRLCFLEIDGIKTAATLSFDYNDMIFLYNSGHNTEYSSLGSSFLLKAICIREAINKGKHYFDLLRGTEPYKQHLGAIPRELFTLTISK